jgi:hypothetical protein
MRFGGGSFCELGDWVEVRLSFQCSSLMTRFRGVLLLRFLVGAGLLSLGVFGGMASTVAFSPSSS